MNIGTVIGFVFGLFILFLSILFAVEFEFGRFLLFGSIESLLIVLGMTVAATLIAYPFQDVKKVFDDFKKAFAEDESPVEQYISGLATISNTYARGGDTKLSSLANEYADNQFIKEGLEYIELRYTEALIKSIMSSQIQNEHQRLLSQVQIIKNMSANAPAFGVVGTLIGLVVMMSGLDPSDTEKLMQGLGSGMATALLTTFYGVLSSNFIFSPIATKIEKRIEDQILMMRVCMEGIILVLKKTPENMVRDQLKVYLPVQWASISSNNAQQMTGP